MISLGLSVTGSQKEMPYFPPDPPPPSPSYPEVLDYSSIKGGLHIEFSVPNGLSGGISKWIYFATDGITTYTDEPFVPVNVAPGIAKSDFTNFTTVEEWQFSFAAVDGKGVEWWCQEDIYFTPLASGEFEIRKVARTPVQTPHGFNLTTTPPSGSGAGISFVVDEAQTIFLVTE